MKLTVAPATLVAKGASAAVPPATGGVATTSFFDQFDRLDEKRWYVSDGWVNGAHQGCMWSRQAVRVSDGTLKLHVAKGTNKLRGFRCAEVRTHAKLGYGWYEARMRTAAGSGLNAALFTYSGPPLTKVHDEIDFEFLGKAPRKVQLNYWAAAAGKHESWPDLGVDTSQGFHDYAFEWTPGRIRWFMDGRLLRTSSDARMPDTGGQFFATLWIGSASVNDWLGPLDETRLPATSEVEWMAYTRAGERCRFAASLSCRP